MVTVGVDEVGRGCWAGPLVAGAVILQHPIAGLKDSKLLSARQREMLASIIKTEAASIGIGWVSSDELDAIGLTEAVRLAMQRALRQIMIDFDEVIIDGNYNFLAEDRRARALIKADMTVPAASAASIIAKVARDNYMKKISGDYADYGFERHVGYGTALHIQKLHQHGVCAIHRRSFKPIKTFLGSMP